MPKVGPLDDRAPVVGNTVKTEEVAGQNTAKDD